MANITLVGRLQDYAGKAMDALYKTADKLTAPVLDKFAGIDFAGSYFNNSAIPEDMKYKALHRNFLRNESAIAQIGGEFPAPGKKMELSWKDFWKIAAAVGVLSAAGGGYAYMKKKDFGMDDIDSGIAYAKHEISAGASGISAFLGNIGSAPPVVDNPAVNASAVATPQVSGTPQPAVTPQPDYLMYDGIKVIGGEQFQKDNLMWLEFAKKYSPADYEFIKSKNKWIVSDEVIPIANAGGDGFYFNRMYLRKLIESKDLKTAAGIAKHESGHNDLFYTDRMNEIYPQKLEINMRNNFSYVNQSEIEKFIKEHES
jgi:hypothetical protein